LEYFEIELKNQLVKSFQKLLTDNSIQEFEHNLSKHFYRQSFEYNLYSVLQISIELQNGLIYQLQFFIK